MATRKRRGTVTELDGETIAAKFSNLCSLGVYAQAKWFLKCHWSMDPLNIGTNLDVAEHVYVAAKDLKERAHGANDLEQLKAHHFLEKVDDAIRYVEFKAMFKELDLDFNNRLSLTEYLVYKYKLGTQESVATLVNSPQEVVAGLSEAEGELERCNFEYAKAMEALDAVQAVMQQIKDMEDGHAEQADKLSANIDKHEGKIVKQNVAKKKLEVHMNDHPVDNKMRLTQKAAVRKAKKASARFELELQSAQEMVEVIKNSGTSAHAVLWWMERDLKEMEKTMSKKQFERKQRQIQRKKAKADADMAAAQK